MNIEELRAEANSLGYSLTKKITYEKPLKCRCSWQGWHMAYEVTFRGKYYRCTQCGYAGEIAKTKYQAIANWNKAVNDTDAYLKYREEQTKKLLEAWK